MNKLNKKSILKIVVSTFFICALFFNTSLSINENGSMSLTLEDLQTAQAQDSECDAGLGDCYPYDEDTFGDDPYDLIDDTKEEGPLCLGWGRIIRGGVTVTVWGYWPC